MTECFEPTFERISEDICPRLLRGKPDIAFRDLINRSLPAYFWDFFNVLFDPRIGELIRLGALNLDHRKLLDAPDYLKQLRTTLRFSAEELKDLLKGGLRSRLTFVLSPADEVTNLLYEYRTGESATAHDLARSLNSLEKLLENWSQRVFNAMKAIEPYIAGKGEEPIARLDFRKIIASAVEKEASREPLSWVLACLEDLDSLLQLDPAPDEVEKIDMLNPVSQILQSRGLTFWTPALAVEKEIRRGFLSLNHARSALIRLNLFLAEGLLGPHHSEDLGSVSEEIEGFTGFLEEETHQ